jgi:hypothetical protein
LGARFYTIITTFSGKTFTLTPNGAAVVLTEGAGQDFLSITSAAVTATNLAAAINASASLNTLLSAAAVGAVVYLTRKRGLRTLTIATNAAGGEATATSGTDGAVLNADGAAFGGSGDVVGPGSSTDNAVARFDLATGKLLQNSVVLIDDTGALDLNSDAGLLRFGDAQDVTLARLGAASLRMGSADSATPLAQVFTLGESARAGTDTNVAGAGVTWRTGLGTGNAAVTAPAFIFQTPTAVGSGTGAQTYATRLTVATTLMSVSVPIKSSADSNGVPVYRIDNSTNSGFGGHGGDAGSPAVHHGGTEQAYWYNGGMYMLANGQALIYVNSGTITALAPALRVIQTWNNVAITFKAATIEITDTASAAGSLFVDYLVGAASKFAVNKAGDVLAAGVFKVAGTQVVGARVTGVAVTAADIHAALVTHGLIAA